jgi:transcriptional regulator with XRE-family HTH domain
MKLLRGEELKIFLKKKGISATEISERLGITRTSLSRYFGGEFKPSLEFYFKLSEEFKIPLSSLILDLDSLIEDPEVKYGKDTIVEELREVKSKIFELEKKLSNGV